MGNHVISIQILEMTKGVSRTCYNFNLICGAITVRNSTSWNYFRKLMWGNLFFVLCVHHVICYFGWLLRWFFFYQIWGWVYCLFYCWCCIFFLYYLYLEKYLMYFILLQTIFFVSFLILLKLICKLPIVGTRSQTLQWSR